MVPDLVPEPVLPAALLSAFRRLGAGSRLHQLQSRLENQLQSQRLSQLPSPLTRQLRHDVVFWAARGKRLNPVHYWDVGVPRAAMTSATARRFLGLPSKRQREWEARIDNGNGRLREGLPGSMLDDERGYDFSAEDAPPRAEDDERPGELDKREFWASRGKKNGGDFWASRGKKNGGSADFWASRGRRGDPGDVEPLLPQSGPRSGQGFSGEPVASTRGRWSE